jgi:ketosteroid isomerase-like protein
MKKLFFPGAAVCFSTLVVLLSSCNNEPAKTAEGPAFNLDSVKTAIAASNAAYSSCFATGDSMKFASAYTTDACVNPPNNPRICGTQGIMAFFNGAVKMGVKNLKITTEEVMGGADAVAEVGKYELMGDKDAPLDKGKFIVVWKTENGKWKMHRDEWNSDNPPPPAEKK